MGLILFSEKIILKIQIQRTQCVWFCDILVLLYVIRAQSFYIQPYKSTKNYKLQTENVAQMYETTALNPYIRSSIVCIFPS